MLNILLIDDQPKLLRDILAVYGYVVDVAGDGLEGVDKLMALRAAYELVILDINVPRMDGWEVLRKIRHTPHTMNLPVIILTSYDTEDYVVKGLRRGADLYLGKPISPRFLLAHIEALTRRVNREQDDGNGRRLENEEAEVPGLTRRENEIVKFLVKGYSNQQIASELIISETTVKNHLAHIFRKLKVTNRTQAAYLARRMKPG